MLNFGQLITFVFSLGGTIFIHFSDFIQTIGPRFLWISLTFKGISEKVLECRYQSVRLYSAHY